MGEVRVIKAADGAINRRLGFGSGVNIERKRVAAYVRVSTDGEEQLQSFQSQKEYYEDKISKNKDWAMVGIYADEGITGTKTAKRDGFLRMIDDCMNGMIDIILTKSISRFSRNLVDTLQYVRMLKEKNIAIIFEKENINTLSMESEMALALLSTLAQNEVESLSANVKMGIKMKMKRGELMGFNGCLGYDYHPEDKTITVNKEEAKIVKFIYDMYVQGFGTNMIRKELVRLQKKNKKGQVVWSESGVLGILKNEKYKGDILLGKTFTVDPISKRRLENMGEEEQYYIEDHHEPIVSKEVWEKAQKIREARRRKNNLVIEGTRIKAVTKYAFSGMCECAFCGKKFTRRSHHQDTKTRKPVWKCSTASKKGISYCPHSKAVDEAIIESAFLEMFELLATNYEDVLEEVLGSIEETISISSTSYMINKINKHLDNLENRRRKLTDMLLDDKISKNAYDEKYDELTRKIDNAKHEREIYLANADTKQDVNTRMNDIREILANEKSLDKFDRTVFDSIVDRIIIGEKDAAGNIDAYKITFVLKGVESRAIPDARRRYKKK